MSGSRTTINLLLPVISALFFSASPAAEILTIGGLGAALETTKMLGEAFQRDRPDVEIVVQPSLGSSGGIRAVAKGAVDLGIAGRSAIEKQQARGLQSVGFARTPLVFVAHPAVPADNITREELLAYLQGNRHTWPEGQRCRPIVRPVRDSETIALKRLDPELGKAIEGAVMRRTLLVTLTSQLNADALERTRGSLGYSSLALLTSEKRSLKVLDYEGKRPTTENLAKGDYPFFSEFTFVFQPDSRSVVRDFVDFVFSSRGQAVLTAAGSLPIPRDDQKHAVAY